MSRPSIPILGLPLACETYESAWRRCEELARAGRAAAVSACNTHIVSSARQNADFGLVMSRFDMVVPDGTPLKWILNARGAGLPDRVYGPYLMRHAIRHAPHPWKHFFFGGSPECLANLEKAVRTIQPDFQLVGSFSPPFGNWTEEENTAFCARIAEQDPDFVWVALGGVRQETWIIRNLHRFKRGVFFAVGDAFELLAGHRPFAPDWIQRAGLTWLYRLLQEPSRLWFRYFKYNSMFLLQMLGEIIFVNRRFRGKRPAGRLRLCFLGARGTPARYAGFETVVEELGSRLAERGHEVTVYNRSNHYREHPAVHRGMDIFYVPTVMFRSLETIFHSSLCALHAAVQPYDLVYLCGVGNASLARWLRWFGKKVVINVDGIDFKRSKWTGFARWWLYKSEIWGLRFADRLIADNRQVVRHYQANHGADPVYLSYGANAVSPGVDAGHLARFGLESRGYLLFVSRLSPENEAHLLLEAHAASGVTLPLVVVGPVGYEKAYFERLKKLAAPHVIFTGPLYGGAYRELSRHCLLFVLPSAIEATRLVLLDQMGFGNAILFRESAATREVIDDAGRAFDGPDPRVALASALKELTGDPAACRALGDKALARARSEYSWDRVTDQYEALFGEMLPTLNAPGRP